MTAQLLLALSILVGIHEWGHMFTAKFFGMRVEKFSIGFPPKLFGFKLGETEYSLGAIPLGGYVKISGMIDESLDTSQIGAPPQPWEFRSKPAWQRLIVMLGGIFMNVVLGIIIFVFMTYLLGERYIPIDKVNQFGIHATDLGKKEIGLQDGDRIVGMNGKPLVHFDDIHNPRFFLEQGSHYTIQRAGTEIKIPIPVDLMDRMSKKEMEFATPMYDKYPLQVEQINGGSAARRSGLNVKDVILAINGQETKEIRVFRELMVKNKNKEVSLRVRRGDREMEIPVQVPTEGVIGIILEHDMLYAKEYYSFLESIPKGAQNAFNVVSLQLQAFGKIFRREISATKSLGGPLAIAQQFGGAWDWIRFWTLTGLLSMVLAFMNLLPIPALDGGHVVFLTYEIVSGRKPSDKFLENAQKVGMVLLLALMVFVFGNDIYKIIVDYTS